MKQKKRLMLWRGSGLAPIPPTPFPNVYSLEFDGIDATAYVGPSDSFNSVIQGTNFTISLWFNSSANVSYDCLLSNGTPCQIYVESNKIKIWMGYPYLTNLNPLVSSATLSLSTWYHLAFVKSGSDWYIYLDGAEDSTVSDSGTVSASTDNLAIGLYPATSAYPFAGNIDEVSIWSSALSAGDIATLASGPNDLKTVLASTPVAWWRNGDSGTFFAGEWDIPDQMKIDNWSSYSMAFDGINDYISIPSFTTSGDDLTLSFWFNAVKLGSGTSAFLWGDSDNFIYYNSNEIIYCEINGTLSYLICLSGGVPQLFGNGWHHIAITKSGSTVTWFLDGVSFSPLGGGTTGGFSMDTMGSATAGAYYFLEGNMDDVAIFDEVKAIGDLWDGSGAPTDLSAESGLVAYYRMGESGVFNANTEWEIPNYKKINYFSNRSMTFDGIDDYIDMGASFVPPSAISISVWIKTTMTTGVDSTNIGYIVAKDNVGSDRDFYLYYRGTGYTKIYFSFWDASGTNSSLTSSAGLIADGEWHHVLATWDGTTDANKIQLFIDGSLDTQGTANATGIRSSTGTNLTLGGADGGSPPSRPFIGSIDDVAIFSNDQSANVATIYNSGVPTDLSAESGLVGYWRMGESGYWNATNWQLPDYSKQALFSQKSFEFDGVDQYIDCGNDSSLAIPNTLTVSCWVKTSTTANEGIVFKGTGNGDWAIISQGGTPSYARIFLNGGGKITGTLYPINDGSWHHIAFTYDSGLGSNNLVLYVDGASDGTANFTTALNDTAGGVNIGRYYSDAYGLDGMIDDVSIYNVAKSAVEVATIYNLGVPKDESATSGLVAYWTFDDATFDTNWTIPDNSPSGTNTGTSVAMDEVDLKLITPTNPNRGESSGMAVDDVINQAPENMEQGLSVAMDEVDKINNAPDNTAQGRSVAMDKISRVEDVPS